MWSMESPRRETAIVFIGSAIGVLAYGLYIAARNPDAVTAAWLARQAALSTAAVTVTTLVLRRLFTRPSSHVDS